MFKWITKLLEAKPVRKELRCVSYHQADALLADGWRIARPEEDTNKKPFMVYLELMEKANG